MFLIISNNTYIKKVTGCADNLKLQGASDKAEAMTQEAVGKTQRVIGKLTGQTEINHFSHFSSSSKLILFKLID